MQYALLIYSTSGAAYGEALARAHTAQERRFRQRRIAGR